MPEDPFIGYATEALRFDRLLGKGGMGAVYLGEQLRMNRTVAIKVIAPHLVADPKYIERFTREAQVLGRLVHPNIIACHDYGPTLGPTGQAFYVMVLEYVDGWSLGSLTRQKRLTVRQALDLYRQAAEGLAFAHRLGVVHRDIKPDNLLVTRNGIAKIADFGLARCEDSVQVTQTGAIIGSPAYMAPEACRGEDPTPRSDIYSLGCSLFQTLTDQPPYTSQSTLQVLNQHISDPVPNLLAQRPDLVRLQALLARCLAKRPADRWSDCEALAQALAAEIPHHAEELVAGRLLRNPSGARAAAATVLTGAAITVRETQPAESPRMGGPSNRGWYMAVGLAVGVLVVVAWASMPNGSPIVAAPARPMPAIQVPPIEADHPTTVAGIPAVDLDHILEDAEQAFAAGKTGEAEASMRTLRSLVPAEQMPAEVRSRMEALADKLARRKPAVPPTAPQPPVGEPRMLKPVRGEAVPARQLPDQAPLGPQTILRSLGDGPGSTLRLRLPTGVKAGDQDGVVVMLGSDDAQRVTATAVGPSGRQELASFTVAERAWSVNIIPLKPGSAVEEVVLTGSGSPLLFVSAAIRTGALPTARDLAICPGTLTTVRDLNRVCESLIVQRPDFPKFAATRVIVPQAAVQQFSRPELLAAINRGLLTVGDGATVGIGDSALRTYVGVQDLGQELDAVAEPHLVLVWLPTSLPRLAFHALRPERFLDKGVLPVLILGSDGGRPGTSRMIELLMDSGKRPLQALVDLGAVPSFYQAQGVVLDPASPEYTRQVLGGLEAGLRQLRDRLQAVSENFSRKLDKK